MNLDIAEMNVNEWPLVLQRSTLEVLQDIARYVNVGVMRCLFDWPDTCQMGVHDGDDREGEDGWSVWEER